MKLANNLTEITLNEFFKSIQSKFYSNVDISFMKYFLELTEYNDEFHVHHTKLVDYGIMSSTESSKVKDKIINLELVENEDYVLKVASKYTPSGTTYSNHYYLTPEAFKLCLIRTRRYSKSKQPVNPKVYCRYYLLLEKIFNLYTSYECAYNKRLLAMEKAKTNRLINLTIETFEERNGLQVKLDELSEYLGGNLEIALHYLQERSQLSTKVPQTSGKRQCVCAVLEDNTTYKLVKFITGQEKYVDSQIQTELREGNTIEIQKFYNANGIDLKNNTCEEFVKKRNELLTTINEKGKKYVNDLNQKLYSEIQKFNQGLTKLEQRVFSKEQFEWEEITTDAIPVEFTTKGFTYVENKYMTYEEVLNIIIDINKVTQATPIFYR